MNSKSIWKQIHFILCFYSIQDISIQSYIVFYFSNESISGDRATPQIFQILYYLYESSLYLEGLCRTGYTTYIVFLPYSYNPFAPPLAGRWDHLFLYLFYTYNSLSIAIFHFPWKMQSDVWGAVTSQHCVSYFSRKSYFYEKQLCEVIGFDPCFS